ncbi:MAG: HD domain-containing protein [Bacteroidales bacterium]|nr:HD domain-containing protein [Bacteroidales bacterium]
MVHIDTNEVEDYIKEVFKEKIPECLTYHNIIHTDYVVNQAKLLGEKSGLNEEEMNILIVAAWFHDSGFIISSNGHEDESKKIAQKFLSSKGVDKNIVDRVSRCIEATKIPQKPGDDIIAKVLCDADMSYLSEKFYLERTLLLRKEWNNISKGKISKKTYFKETIKMFENHQYHTEYGKKVLAIGKEENYNLLHKMLRKEEKRFRNKLKKLKVENEKLSKKLSQEKIPARGIESMFRLTARNQINLSSIADNKANILISINTIVLTVLVTIGVGKIVEYPNITIPGIIFIATCLLTIIFAILSTRPKISSGKFTKEDIHNKKVNLLFFGNFYNMKLDEYDWAVKEMMKDYNYLYSNMIKDQYSLGKVISKKYRLLRIAYTIFMLGLILSTISFVIIVLAIPT